MLFYMSGIIDGRVGVAKRNGAQIPCEMGVYVSKEDAEANTRHVSRKAFRVRIFERSIKAGNGVVVVFVACAYKKQA